MGSRSLGRLPFPLRFGLCAILIQTYWKPPPEEQSSYSADRQWVVEQQIAVRDNETVEVRVSRQRSTEGVESALGAGDRWFHPSTSLPDALEVAEGPIDPTSDTMVVLAKNSGGEPLYLSPGVPLGFDA